MVLLFRLLHQPFPSPDLTARFHHPTRPHTEHRRRHHLPTITHTLPSPPSINPTTHRPRTTRPIISATSRNSEKGFWAGVGLIVGTAVGPGMLGLPSATIRSGPLPSSVAIFISWVYVVSSILLVAELSFSSMEADGVEEVSFTALARDAFGPAVGAFVAAVYACLSFSLLIACVSGIGSLVVQGFPRVDPVVAHAAFPCFVGAAIGFFPFSAIDTTNRVLCAVMLFSITALVMIGMSIGKSHVLSSLVFASWSPSSIMPAIPLTVLTLGFHVITPFVCKVVGKSNAQKVILLGGAVPLVMVLSWNLVVLGLTVSISSMACSSNPIKLLLSVSPSALPAVCCFAFAALATSLIGYSVSFPKQLGDTVVLTLDSLSSGGCKRKCSETGMGSGSRDVTLTWVVLGISIIIASFFQAAFSKALDFAGVYANCFLFGILPPAMAWLHRSRRAFRSSYEKEIRLLPGGNISLFLLFVTAIILFFWH